MNLSKKKLLVSIFVGFFVIVLGILFYTNYINSTKEITVFYKNSSDIELFDISEGQEGHDGTKNIVSVIHSSGDIVRLDKEKTYLVSYMPNDGFVDDDIIFKPSQTNKITIDPYYSEKKLSTLLELEFESIKQSLVSKYTNIVFYEIQRGKLYHFGEWYGTTLKYTGNDIDNSDTLRVVLHKKDGVWKIQTDPPSISLSKYAYPNIPHDILSDVNNFQKTPMLERFTNPDTSHGPGGQ